MPLGLAPVGKEVMITKVFADDKTRRHLENLGIMVGGALTSLSAENGNMIVRIKDGRLALDRTLAMKIFVR